MIDIALSTVIHGVLQFQRWCYMIQKLYKPLGVDTQYMSRCTFLEQDFILYLAHYYLLCASLTCSVR